MLLYQCWIVHSCKKSSSCLATGMCYGWEQHVVCGGVVWVKCGNARVCVVVVACTVHTQHTCTFHSLKTPAGDAGNDDEDAAEVLAASTGLQECSICVSATAFVVVDVCNHSMCGTCEEGCAEAKQMWCTYDTYNTHHSDVCTKTMSRISQRGVLPLLSSRNRGVSSCDIISTAAVENKPQPTPIC